ncbi:MAG: polysaccharide biosynthesis protein [Anaerostipes sp.]|nr:polysaccharide biosynthesis protein [Anaerostipes sp.]
MRSQKSSVIKQASILVIAGILCRIIGILYRSPLTAVIGNEGNGYYSVAYNIYTIILLISSYSIPTAISKEMSQRIALDDYKNAYKIFKCSLLYVLAIGGLFSVFTYTCSDILVGSNSSSVLKIFAPCILLSGILGTFRGFFQAHNSMVQTSVSQIIEQLANAIFSIGVAYFFIQSYTGNNSTVTAIKGAMGSATGTCLGVIFGLLFMMVAFAKNRSFIKEKSATKSMHVLSTKHIFKIIILTISPIILSTFIYNFSTTLNQTLYTKVMFFIKGISESQIAKDYGVFAGKVIVIQNIPIAIASSISTAVIPSIAGSYASGNHSILFAKIKNILWMITYISIPSAVGIFVLSRPLMLLLFPQLETLELSVHLLMFISISIIFYSISTVTNGILQALGEVKVPVKNAFIALILQTIVLVFLLLFTSYDLYAMGISTILYSMIMCILNQVALKKFLNKTLDIQNSILKLLFISCFMGLTVFSSYKGIYFLLKSNIISLAFSVLFGTLIYFALSIKQDLLDAKLLQSLPFGNSLISILKALHITK